MNETIRIEVAFARPDSQLILDLEVAADCTIEQAINASDIVQHFPEIDLAVNKVGIWGKAKKLGDGLREGDRIEIYRPLIADPKEIRRQKAAEGKALKRGRVKSE